MRAGASKRAHSESVGAGGAEGCSIRQSMKTIRAMEGVTGLGLIGRNGGIRIE